LGAQKLKDYSVTFLETNIECALASVSEVRAQVKDESTIIIVLSKPLSSQALSNLKSEQHKAGQLYTLD
jgi:hypothetical protein